VARESLSDDNLQPRLRLDHEITFGELNNDFLGWHEMLQPFGNGNSQPLFFARGIEPAIAPRIVGESHLALVLRQQNYKRRAIFFGAALNPLPPHPWDVAFRIRPDHYEGETRLEIRVEAVREAAPMT
jgi:single-stranded-DNA-specific exonuclease